MIEPRPVTGIRNPRRQAGQVLKYLQRSNTAPRLDESAGYGAAVELAEEVALSVADRIARQSAEAPELVVQLLGCSAERRSALISADERFRSAPLAARLLDVARERPDRLELLRAACQILDAVATEECRDLRVGARVALADALRLRGDWEGAEADFARAAYELRHSDPSFERADFCLALARHRWEQGRVDEALALAERAVRVLEALGDEEASAVALVEGGDHSLELGDCRAAADCYSRALCRNAKPEQIFSAVRGLALSLVLLGANREALAVVRQVRRRRFRGLCYEGLALASLEGQMHLRLGQTRLARALLEQAFRGLLRLTKKPEALVAGIALLRARRSAPFGVIRDLAAQLAPLVDRRSWPVLDRLLRRLCVDGGKLLDDDLHAVDDFLSLQGRADVS